MELKTLTGAIMVTGPEGTGVDDYAVSIAAKILETEDVLLHPDCLVVVPSGKLGYKLEDLQEFRSAFGEKALRLDRRVFVFKSAQTMSGIIQDSLLKCLEDGADDVIILATTDTTVMLDTVVSRCLVIATRNLLKATDEVVVAAAKTLGASADEVLCACQSRGEWLEDMLTTGALQDVILALRVVGKDNRALMEILHLVKEKDDKNFFNYGKTSVKALLLALHNVYTSNRLCAFCNGKKPVYVFEHSEEECQKALRALEEGIEKSKIMTANDFLGVIMELI